LRLQNEHLRRINSDLGILLHELRAPICRTAEARHFFCEMAKLYLERIGRANAEWFGEKTPEHTSRIDTILETFPGAKLIFIYRDGRDVAISLAKAPWIRSDVYVGMLIWTYYMRFLRYAKLRHSAQSYFVSYESLVHDPEAHLAGIASFLGVSYEPPMAAGCGNREGIPERELAWKGEALRPIHPGRVANFRQELTTSQVAMVEAIGGRTLSEWGYELQSRVPPIPSPVLLARLGLGLAGTLVSLPWNDVVCEAVKR
jgi:hypothetical protein